jgi:hypothetical protein
VTARSERRVAVLALLLAAGGWPAGARGQPNPAAGGTPPGAQGTRAAVTRLVDTFVGQLRLVTAAESPAPRGAARRQAPLTACTSLYHQDVRAVAEGPELAKSYGDWLTASYAVIRKSGGLPLPICFRSGSAAIETNVQRYLLHVNSKFIDLRYRAAPASAAERRYYNGYELVGHSDPEERDDTLASLRAQGLKAQLPGPECRYVVRTEPAAERVHHRKVFYAYRPAVTTCPRLPN